MKVAVVGITPTSVHLRTYVEYLVEQGHDVTLITNRDFDYPGLRVINFGRHSRLIKLVPSPGRVAMRVARVRTALRSGDFDVVNVQQVTPDGVYAASLWDGPLVLSFWGSDIHRLDMRPKQIQQQMPKVIAKADLIHSVSQHMTAELVAHGADPSMIETFQYGVDLRRFSLSDAPRTTPIILSTRGLRPIYRPEALVRAMPVVLAEVPEARLRLTGDSEERAQVERLAADLAVAGSVDFIGQLTPDDVAAELHHAAVWASIPESDGTPLSLLEALACGALPVVVDLDATRPWIRDGRGVLVSDVAPQPLAQALLEGLRLAADGSYRAGNRALVEADGDRSVNLARYEAMLKRAISAHRSTTGS